MVDFVEEGAGEEISGFDADFLAVFEEGFDFGFAGAADETINLGDGQTAFGLSDDFAFGFDDLGVNEGGEGILGFVVEVVANDDDALINAHLRGGHGGREFVRMSLFPVERKFDHVGNNFMGFISDVMNLGGFGTQARIGRGDDFSHNI